MNGDHRLLRGAGRAHSPRLILRPLVGFDDFDLAQWVDPPLTTVRLPGYDMGARACELLIARLETGRFPERHVELATELVRRGSS